jgi:assimilatory nitrate reductase catalytic subunit
MSVAPALREVKSTCCYCGVGCGVLIETDGARITGVRGDPDHPANHGRLCSKGAVLHLTARPALDPLRGRVPEMRRDRGAERAPVSWDEALDHAAGRFAAIIAEHGPDAVAFYVSGQLLTEDYYVFNKLAKGLVGTNNIDTNSRLCMSSAVAGYKQTLGADAPPCAYEDLDHAEVVFIAGANPAYAHPVLYRRLEAARAKNPAMRIITVDPRRTDSAREADLHLAILPGTDVALFHGMLHLLLWEGLVDTAFIAAHTEGFDALKALVREWTPAVTAQTCGIAEADLVRAAKWFGESKATLSLYCQGLNQSSSGTAKNAALINLHLATGQIGRPGAGPFSLTGQPNAMGGREVGGLANLLSAHRDLANPTHRAEVARFWGVDDVPATPGKTAVEMFEALRDGTIKAVWIACTNPAQSLPNQGAVHEALAKAELVIVQDAYRDTETARHTDILLPASSWGEKEGTVTNSERRITRIHAAVPAPGEARADWAIAVDFARRLEARLRPGKPTLFPYETTESVWNDHRELTRGRDLDITGLSYALLDSLGPQQWPMPAGATRGRTRLYEDGLFPTPDGRARFAATPFRPVADAVDAKFPLRLTTGRLRDQWHTMSRTGSIAQAFGHAPEPVLEMHERDLARRALRAGDLVRVTSRRGALFVPVAASADVASGQAFLAMHWGGRFLAGTDVHGVNTLTTPAFDPQSKQPELKHTAVRVERAELPWRLVAFAFAGDAALPAVDTLAPLLRGVPYASAVPIGRDREGLLLRVAASTPPAADWLAAVDVAFGLAHARVARYDDARRAIGRRIDVRDGRLHGVRLSGDANAVVAEGWLRDWLLGEAPVDAIRRHLLAPGATAPAGTAPRAPLVCTCFAIDAAQIDECLAHRPGTAAARLDALQAELRCGTNCGSCLPALKRMIADATRPAAVAA